MNPSPSSPPPEFDIWKFKPWWCQPWSILLTGSLVIAASWGLTHLLWLTLPVAAGIALWWLYFLWLWPQAIARSLAAGEEVEGSEGND